MENNHQEKLNQIEAECSEIKRQILQLEFQHKKEMAKYKEESVLRNRQIERHLSHLSKLAGLLRNSTQLMMTYKPPPSLCRAL